MARERTVLAGAALPTNATSYSNRDIFNGFVIVRLASALSEVPAASLEDLASKTKLADLAHVLKAFGAPPSTE